MKTRYSKFLAVAAVACSGMLGSCSLDITNPDGPTATGFFDSEDKFTLNLIAIMQEWRNDFDVMTMRSAGELRSGIYTITGIDGSALNDITYVENALDVAHPQFNNFGGYYGVIGNLNGWLYYAEENSGVFNSEAAKHYMTGMVKGMRAYCYFQLYKMYGEVPLQTFPSVQLGVFDREKLTQPREACSVILKFIKDEIAASISEFAAGASYTNQQLQTKNFWTPAATQMLAGEVYLWSGKVSTGDHTADPADVATAKGYFENVVNNYGFAMQNTYDNVFAVANNSEVIFSTFYGYTIATGSWQYASLWNPTTGQAKGQFWNCFGEDGTTPISTAYRTGTYVNEEGEQVYNYMYYHGPASVNRYQYRNAVWYQFNENDTRRSILQDQYLATNAENGLDENGDPIEGQDALIQIENFDKDAHHLAGVFVYKYKGQEINNSILGINHMIYYRLPLAYMYLAEIANYNGNNTDVEFYINKIRERAYGANWDASVYGYTAGSFRENEVAILQEKTKEFLQEGQRWWDIRRLTGVKGGTPQDHLIFQPESCAGWGLDLASHPMWNEVCSNLATLEDCPVLTNKPVLDWTTQKQMVLWPINQSLISDKVLQTEGYK